MRIFSMISALLLISFMSVETASAATTWKLVSSFSKGMVFLHGSAEQFADRLARASDKSIKVRTFSAGELVGAMQVFDAVSKGSVEAGWSVDFYWAGKDPAFKLFGNSPFGLDAQAMIGWLDGEGGRLLQDLYEPFNIVPITCGMMPPEGELWSAKELGSASDLRRYRVRQAGLHMDTFSRAGALVSPLPGGEVYLALERGVIDGANFSNPTLDEKMGFKDLVKHYYYPSVMAPSTPLTLMINKKAWNILSSGQQNIVRDVCRANTQAVLSEAIDSDARAIEKIRQSGVKVQPLPEEIVATLKESYQAVVKEQSSSRDFRKVYESMQRAKGGTGQQAVAFKPQNPGLPPQLHVEVVFEEPSGNRVLDALEEGALVVTLKNSGQGDSSNVTAMASWAGTVRAVTVPKQTQIGRIPAGGRTQIRIPIHADKAVSDRTLQLNLTFPEARGFDADPVSMTFDTKAFAPPRLILADFGINDTSGNGQVEPGELVEVTARVQNVGSSEASQVSAQVQAGENVFLAAGSAASQNLGDLAAGAFADMTFSFYTNRRIQPGQELPLSIRLNESRDRFEATEALAIRANVPQQRGRKIVVEAVASAEPDRTAAVESLSVDVDRNIPKGSGKNPHAVAVVIGNADYEHASAVAFAKNDAATVRRYLIETMGYDPANILYLENATLADFNTLFGNAGARRSKLRDYVRDGKSDVFVYYSGHGVPDQNEGGSPYFVPVNADPNYITGSGYPVTQLRENLANLPARSLTVVIDACFSGMTAAGDVLLRDVSPALLVVRNEVAAPEGSVYMASAGPDQVSTWYREKKHSMFTYWWLKGLSGAADADRNRQVTVGEMKAFLQEEVPYQARRSTGQQQTPVIHGDQGRVLAELR